MKDRFDLNNLPLAFFDDFHNIEADEVKEALLGIVNVMYDDYTIEEVQDMFSTFAKAAYEIYELNLYRNEYSSDKFNQDLDLLIEVILFCSSQLETYQVHNPVNSRTHR